MSLAQFIKISANQIWVLLKANGDAYMKYLVVVAWSSVTKDQRKGQRWTKDQEGKDNAK